MSCLFSTPEQPPRQTRETPRFAMNPEAVMAAALGGAGAGPEDMDVGWLASSPPNHYADGSNDDDHGIVSPYHDVFPKREIFDNFDLSRIPLSLFTGSSMPPAALGSSAPAESGIVPDAAAACTVAELGTALTPESISPTTLTPPSSSSSACITGIQNPLVFDATAAATFGQHSEFYSLHGSTSPLVDAQGLRTRPAPTPLLSSSSPMTTISTQSIRAPISFLSNDERPSPSSRTNSGNRKDSVTVDSGRGQDPMATTPPPPPPSTRKLSHPQPLFQTPKHHGHSHSITPRKRKSSGSGASSTSSRSSSSPPPTQSPGSGSGSSTSPSNNNNNTIQPRKSTHNMIEKRYRTNINEKIAALRDAVPSLRLMVHRMEREGGCGGAGAGGQGTFLNGGIAPLSAGESILMDDAELSSLEAEQSLLGGLAPAHKLNKATVLSKATEYIAHLERNNAALTREVGQLRDRVADVEMILMQQPHHQPPPPPPQHHHHQHHHQQIHQQMAYDVGTW